MEKIIYNTKLKRILIVLLLVAMVSNFFVPIVRAEDDVIVFYAETFYWKRTQKANGDYKHEEYELEVEANSPVLATNPTGTSADWDLDTYKLYQEKTLPSPWGASIDVIRSVYSDVGSGTIEDAFVTGGCAEYNKVLAEQHAAGVDFKNAIITASEAGAKYINDNYNDAHITSAEDLVDTLAPVGEDIASSIGGILLTPVFYLVNFVADAIVSNLGRIMIGNDASFGNVTGTTILQKDEIPLDSTKTYVEYAVDMDKLNLLGTVQYPNIPYTPEEIFSGKIDLLSIDFISGKNSEGEEITGSWASIRTVIAQWYQVLRMIAIIGLLSVLIYTGIKIMISANAKDKAKYKEWIINWFMAAAILFFMHVIMAFIVAVTGELSKLISQTSEGIAIVNGDDKSATNLMGLVRFMIQSEDFYMKIGYEVMYIALIVYTIKFTITYLKRVLNMAFLTLIAPIVALTYPIDKINDGRAQGFDMWLKEYIFNALLQPMHQLMYYILVGSAVSIAASNPIYGIVVLMFMAEAEKLLKKIFGFDKASGGTVGGMTSAFAAGAIASNISKMIKLPSGNAGKGGAGSSGGAGSTDNLLDNVKPERDKGIADEKDLFLNDTLDGDDSSGGNSGGGAGGGSNVNLDSDAGGGSNGSLDSGDGEGSNGSLEGSAGGSSRGSYDWRCCRRLK